MFASRGNGPSGLFPLLPEGDMSITLPAPPLDPIRPSFILPPLDENAPGIERLLGAVERRGLKVSTTVKNEEPLPVDPFEAETEVPPLQPPEQEEEQEEEDVWAMAAMPDAGPSRRAFEIHTWDDEPSHAPFLSEAQSTLFESLLTSSEPPLQLPKLRTPVVPPPVGARALLDLMMRATLGTAMTDTLRWSRRAGRFVYSANGARPAGLERRTANDLMDEFLTIGTAVRRVEIVVEDYSATPLTPTHHALFYSLSTILAHMKQTLTAAVESCSPVSEQEGAAPWLCRVQELEDMYELSEALCAVICWPIDQSKPVGLPARPASVLTHLHSHLLAHISTATRQNQRGPIPLTLAFLLQHSSQPFLDQLHAWIGLADASREAEDIDPESQPWADLGITRSPLPPAPGMEHRWEYTFTAKRMPAFVPRDVRRTLFEAGRSLRALKEASGGLHPLCSTEWYLKASWGWGSSGDFPTNDLRHHPRRVQREIERWRDAGNTRTRTISSSSIGSVRRRQPDRMSIAGSPTTHQGSLPSVPGTPPMSKADDLWAMFAQPPGSGLSLFPTQGQANSAAPLWAPTPVEELDAFLKRHSDPNCPLLPIDSPTLELYVSTHLLAPLLTHSALISRALVSVYLEDLQFLDHLDVLRAFWLGGDADFAERVGAAMFGKDMAGPGNPFVTGKRAQTRARLGLDGGSPMSSSPASPGLRTGDWGIGLGLGLSDRKRWPPGGAQLAYALRSSLLEDEAGRLVQRNGAVWDGIEDRVSFALGALPEETKDGVRAKWLNPQAIEALDFLHLAYSPPITVGSLLPPAIMAKYQLIHNLLLRLARVDVVLRNLYFNVLRPAPPIDGEPVKTGVDAAYNRMPSKVGLRTRRTVSVFEHGSDAERALLYVRYGMSWFVSAVSRYVLDTAIGQNWDIMRRRLERLRRATRRGDTTTVAGATPSRPVTPGPDGEEDEYDFLDDELSEAGGVDDEAGATQLGALSQLESAHSLVLYHHIILNRIMRACLLSPQPGHQVTFKILMALLGLVLDLGKALKEAECGAISLDAAAEVVKGIAVDWADKLAVFLHALERLSLRTSKHGAAADDESGSGGGGREGDIQLLLDGERRGDDERALPGSAELQELLLRLKLGGAGKREGRYQ